MWRIGAQPTGLSVEAVLQDHVGAGIIFRRLQHVVLDAGDMRHKGEAVDESLAIVHALRPQFPACQRQPRQWRRPPRSDIPCDIPPVIGAHSIYRPVRSGARKVGVSACAAVPNSDRPPVAGLDPVARDRWPHAIPDRSAACCDRTDRHHRRPSGRRVNPPASSAVRCPHLKRRLQFCRHPANPMMYSTSAIASPSLFQWGCKIDGPATIIAA